MHCGFFDFMPCGISLRMTLLNLPLHIGLPLRVRPSIGLIISP